MELIINTDGASRGNPGKAAYAFVIKTADGVLLHQEGRCIGQTTNNVAEYTAVEKALGYVRQYLKEKGPHVIKVLSDSQLITSQLSGRFKLKNEELKIIFDRVKILETGLGQVCYSYIPREQNFIADRLANQALDLVFLK